MINKRPHEAEGLFDDDERWAAVSVDARIQTDGTITPLQFELDGLTYKIDRILDRRVAKSRKELLSGTRYLVLVQERRYLLYHDRGFWYLEWMKVS